MIIVKINGGLGNQLQQYALSEKLRLLGKEVKLDVSWFSDCVEKLSNRDLELDYFPNISYEICSEEEKKQILGNRNKAVKVLERLGLKAKKLYVEHKMYDENILSMDDMVLEGYFACEGYYADIIPHLQQKLQFPKSENKENEIIGKQIQETQSVSLHIRRGDYLNPENKSIFDGICTEEYYEQAVKKIQELVENPHFYIFSDDPEYARRKYAGEEYTVVDINHGKDSFFDMYLMSLCKHNICANSTFSFWGARLNQNEDKIMIRPLKQRNNCNWYVPEKMKELWKNWLFMDEKGHMC